MKAKYILLLPIATLTLTACVGVRDKNTSNNVAVNAEDVISTEMVEVFETEIVETEVVETESEIEMSTEAITSENEDKPVYEIVNGCYKGVPLQGETMQDSWTKQVTWKASNGTYIKINDEWADYVERTGDGSKHAIWERDPDKDLRPDADYMRAIDEFIYSDEAYHNGMDRYDPEVVNVDNLPKVSTVSEKKDSFIVTDEFQAYIDEWNLYHSFQATGFWETSLLHSVHFKDDFVGCIAEGQGYLWKIERESDYWKLTINTNPSELNWHGILTCLKMVSPDAQSVYQTVYDVSYNDVDWIKDYNGWYSIPNSNSEIWVTNTKGLGYMEYKFK